MNSLNTMANIMEGMNMIENITVTTATATTKKMACGI